MESRIVSNEQLPQQRAEASIMTQRELEHGWEFIITITDAGGTSKHVVVLDRGTWELLSRKRHTPTDIITRSIAFLLERESRASILPSFNILEIEQHFPEFMAEMDKQLS